MKQKIIIIWIILVFIIGFISALWLANTYFYGIESALELSVYACHDGCSIATKNKTTGLLTNETWDCWEECNNYIKELREDSNS